jgi:hypothetical protein
MALPTASPGPSSTLTPIKKYRVPAPLRGHVFVKVSDSWWLWESPKNGGFDGFDLKSMLEKHEKPLQGFA